MLSTNKDTLTTEERADLKQLEAILRRDLRGFVEAGRALMEIRDKRLYRATHSTFDLYCREVWGLHKTSIYQKITGAVVVDQLSAIAEDPENLPNEWQSRPLGTLDEPEQKAAAWQAANTIAEGKPSNRGQVERAVKAVKAEVVPAFKIGQAVAVTAKDSPFCGEMVTVVRIDGLVVFCDHEGSEQPFFANELDAEANPSPAQTPPNWTARRDKVDRMQGLEVEVQVYKMRCTALEGVLARLVAAARAGKLTNTLVSEAENLLS